MDSTGGIGNYLIFLRLSNTCCNGKVDKDLTPINQNIVKNTINDLIARRELPATAKNSPSPLLELRVFTFYLKSTNLTTQVDPSSLPAVGSPKLFPAILTKLWLLSSKLYHHILKKANTHFKFFTTLISLAKTKFFSRWTLHLFIL